MESTFMPKLTLVVLIGLSTLLIVPALIAQMIACALIVQLTACTMIACAVIAQWITCTLLVQLVVCAVIAQRVACAVITQRVACALNAQLYLHWLQNWWNYIDYRIDYICVDSICIKAAFDCICTDAQMIGWVLIVSLIAVGCSSTNPCPSAVLITVCYFGFLRCAPFTVPYLTSFSLTVNLTVAASAAVSCISLPSIGIHI